MTDHGTARTLVLRLSAEGAAPLPAHPALPPPLEATPERRETLAGYALPGNTLALLLPVPAQRTTAPPRLATLDAADPPAEPPRHAFVARLSVRRFTLAPEPGTRVEATLETGTFAPAGADPGAAEPVRRLALALLEGEPATLPRLALALHQAQPLTLEAETLAAQGLRLAGGGAPPVRHAHDPGLREEDSLGEALARIVATCVSQMLGNDGAIRAGDVEGVHQMRVAVRQLRAGLRLFAPALGGNTHRPFDARLRALGRLLGEARDWDVFCTETLPAATADGEPAEAMAAAAAAERARTHDALRAHLDTPAPVQLGLELLAWGEACATDGPLAAAALPDHAPALLHTLARKVLRHGRHLTRLPADALHDRRKALKRLRYATDFLAPLFPGRPARRYRKRCRAVQAVLGDINDTSMTASLVARLEESEATRHLLAWTEARRAAAMADLPPAWARLRDAAPFWE